MICQLSLRLLVRSMSIVADVKKLNIIFLVSKKMLKETKIKIVKSHPLLFYASKKEQPRANKQYFMFLSIFCLHRLMVRSKPSQGLNVVSKSNWRCIVYFYFQRLRMKRQWIKVQAVKSQHSVALKCRKVIGSFRTTSTTKCSFQS